MLGSKRYQSAVPGPMLKCVVASKIAVKLFI